MCTSLSLLASSSVSSPRTSPLLAAAVVGFVVGVVVGLFCFVLALAPPLLRGVLLRPVVAVVLGWRARAVLMAPLGVVGVEPEATLAPAQVSSTGEPSSPGISLLLRSTELKNFSAVLRSLKVISVEVEVMLMSVNSPMPWGIMSVAGGMGEVRGG